MSVCGYTPAEIDDLTLFDVVALHAYWRDHPPACDILKAVYGIERQRAVERSPGDPCGIGALIAAFPDGRVREK